jgi:hypothetical protein
MLTTYPLGRRLPMRDVAAWHPDLIFPTAARDGLRSGLRVSLPWQAGLEDVRVSADIHDELRAQDRWDAPPLAQGRVHTRPRGVVEPQKAYAGALTADQPQARISSQ